MSNTLFVLGAVDPEMQAISGLLHQAGQSTAFALCDGAPVHPGNAYRANGLAAATDGWGPEDTIYLVECDFPGWWHGDPQPRIVHVDHHRPGDPGYGKGPEDFLPASSIGQVVALLLDAGLLGHQEYREDAEGHVSSLVGEAMRAGLYVGAPGISAIGAAGYSYSEEYGWLYSVPAPEGSAARRHVGGWEYGVPHGVVLTAAADHCLEVAYRGRCSGVNPDELMRWRAEGRAAFRRQTCKVCAGAGKVEQCRRCSDLKDTTEWGVRFNLGLHDRHSPGGEGGCGDRHDWEQVGCPQCSTAAVLADVERAKKTLVEAECLYLPTGEGTTIRDLRGRQEIRELPEAACRLGLPFVAEVAERGGRRKLVLQAASEGLVGAFLAGEIVPGLSGCYGDPARGFAGGYLP